MTEQDLYQLSGEHVAVLIGPSWQVLGPALSRALEGLDSSAGAVVDVGAGCGHGVRVIADTLPTAEVVAVEPDRGMRTALVAMAAGDPDLTSRVTVLDADLLTARLPATISGLVAMNVLGHFGPAQRHALWQLLRQRLASTGRVVLNLGPLTAEPVPPAAIPEVAVGRRHYGGTAQAEVLGPHLLEWQMDYTVHEDAELVGSATARYPWHVLDLDELDDELAGAGLRRPDPRAGDLVHLITH